MAISNEVGDKSPDDNDEKRVRRIVREQCLGQHSVDLAAMLFSPSPTPETHDSLRVAGYVDNGRAGF